MIGHIVFSLINNPMGAPRINHSFCNFKYKSYIHGFGAGATGSSPFFVGVQNLRKIGAGGGARVDKSQLELENAQIPQARTPGDIISSKNMLKWIPWLVSLLKKTLNYLFTGAYHYI